MPLALNDDQRDFAAMVNQRLSDERDRMMAAGSSDVPPLLSSWDRLHGELAIPLLPVPEALGGEGASWLDTAAAVEQLGADLALGGLPAVLAAVAVLRDSDDEPARQALDELRSRTLIVPTWVGGDHDWTRSPGRVERDGTRPEGARSFVTSPAHPVVPCPEGFAVRLLVPVYDGPHPGIYLTEATEDLPTWPTLDVTTRLVEVDRQSLPAELVRPGDPGPLVERSRAILRAYLAIEAAGASRALLEKAIAHLQDRVQFGATLASMQGLKHEAADLLRRIEPLRSVALAAVDAADEGRTDELVELATAAKVMGDEVFPAAAMQAIQLHGAMGFTWELGVHHHYKRALVSRSMGGDPTQTRATSLAYAGATSPSLQLRAGTQREEPSLTALRDEARDWIAQHRDVAPPLEGAHEPMSYTSTEIEDAWVDLLRKDRWLCLSWPEEYGGRGLSSLEVIAVNEEFARAGVPRPRMGMGETLLAPAILAHGTESQKARLLPRILSGEDVYCQGFSEPDQGSDLARLRTRGVVDGDRIVVSGTKIWQSGAHRANRIFALCRTDPDQPAHAGISYVLLDIPGNNVTVEPIRMMVGDEGFNQVTLDGAVGTLDDVIGGLGQGWKVAMSTLGAERAGEITSQYLGYELEYRHLVDELRRTGRLDERALDVLGDCYLELIAMKSNGRRVVDGMMLGDDVSALLAVDKINWSEYHVRFGSAAMELLGLDGLRRPHGDGYALTSLQRTLLESPGRRIARGTNQIQRNIIAERVLGMPK